MNGDLIIILFVISVAMLAVLVAKLESLWRDFAKQTRYICYEMDHAASYKEYCYWRGELRCHYLCLIPFVNEKNVMRVYDRIYHRADKIKKERKDSLAPLLLPSILGICICTVCVCSMTWAWFSTSTEVPAQKLTAAYYEVAVELVKKDGGDEVFAENGNYLLKEGTIYTVKLSANGTVKDCAGYCLIENEDGSIKLYTQSIAPDNSITISLPITKDGRYIFTGIWGSHPTGISDNEIIKATESSDNGNSNGIPVVDAPSSDNTSDFVSEGSTDQLPELDDGTYTIKSGDTLSGIAKMFDTTVAKLQAYNGMKGIKIIAGYKIKIPPQDYVIPETTAPLESPDPVETDPAVTDPTDDSTAESVTESVIDSQTEVVLDSTEVTN